MLNRLKALHNESIPMSRFSRLLPLCVFALFPIACSQQPAASSATTEETPTDSAQDDMVTETVVTESLDNEAGRPILPPAKFPNAVVYIEAPNIKGTTQLRGEPLQTAQYGSGDFIYTVHLEYLGQGDEGDLYGYSIYVPLAETEKGALAFMEEQFAGEVEFAGSELVLAKDEEAKAIYKLLPESPATP